jgi:hypothetical protein
MAQYHVAGWPKACQNLFEEVAQTKGQKQENEHLRESNVDFMS